MFDFLSKKQKGILGTIVLFGVGAIIAKGICDYSSYKSLKNIEKKLR